MQTVSIVGCGWLGLPLSIQLQSKNYNVIGTSRSNETLSDLKRLGIRPQPLDLMDDTPIPLSIRESQFIVLNIPPRRKVQPIENYQKLILNFIRQLSTTTEKLIFISTTSVYQNDNKEYTEEMANSVNPLYVLEEEIKKLFKNTIVLRCAGLVSEDRLIVDSLSRKQKAVQPNVKVNLVKRIDVIRAIETALKSNKIHSGTYNICSDNHPTKKECYGMWASQFGHTIKFSEDKETGKIISNKAFKDDFNFEYTCPSPLEFFDN